MTKRERSEPVQAQTGANPFATSTEVPAAKRVKADDTAAVSASAANTPLATSPSPAQAAPAVTVPKAVGSAEPIAQSEPASAMQVDVSQQQQTQAQQQQLPQQQQAASSSASQLTPEIPLSALAPTFLPASSQQGTALTAVQDPVARVAVVQHDRIEVRIQAAGSNAVAAESVPAEATTDQPGSRQQSPPTQAALTEASNVEAADVAMPDATPTAQVGAPPEPMPATKSHSSQEDAEERQVSGALNAESAENTDGQAPESETVAATPAGQDEAVDADGAAAGAQKRKAIVFQLPTAPAVESPAPTASGQEQQNEQQQTPGGRGLRGRGVGGGGRGGTAAGNSVRNSARGGQRGRTERGSR